MTTDTQRGAQAAHDVTEARAQARGWGRRGR